MVKTSSRKGRAFYRVLGNLIKAQRVQMGMSQGQLARLSGLPRPSITNLEQGKCGLHLHKFITICKCLDVTPCEMFRAIRLSNLHAATFNG